MFECLKALREANFVHRDVEKRHFLNRANTHSTISLFLVDFGFTERHDDSITHSFQGSAHFAPIELLEFAANRQKYHVKPWHDLVSLINILSLDLHGDPNDKEMLFSTYSSSHKFISKFWNSHYQKYSCCDVFVKQCKNARTEADFTRISEEFLNYHNNLIKK